MSLVDWLREKWSAVARLCRRRYAPPAWPLPIAQEPRTRPTPPRAMPAPPPAEPPPAPQPAALARPIAEPEDETIRELERRRRKHDKFVTPKGELPDRPPPAPKPRSEPKPAPAPQLVHTDDNFVVDRHHEDTQDVLYRISELYGEFSFRDTILQQLERYFVYLARMKKHDAQAFGFYKEMGATLLPYVNTGAYHRQRKDQDDPEAPPIPLADWFHRTRPAFGCYAYGADPETEKFELANDANGLDMWVPKFMYFKKYSAPPFSVEPKSGGDVYALTVWWDRPQDTKQYSKYGRPQEFALFVSADGKQLLALRMLETKLVDVWSKRKHEHFRIPQRGWHIPHEFEDWAKRRGKDVQRFLTDLFLDAVQRVALSQYSMVRVAASKDDMTAVFSVDMQRMSYFFQDRDISVTKHGSRRRIFHIVRPHRRADGTVVKLHFRGERHFTWAGYDVRITIPGRDHPNFADIDVGLEDESRWHKDEDMIDMPALGKTLAERMRKAAP